MEKRTLKFQCLVDMARFSKVVSVGYLMNTNNFTLTGRFTESEIELAIQQYGGYIIETTEKVYSYF
jgi:hypothetical protein